jgi:hypothetical protein
MLLKLLFNFTFVELELARIIELVSLYPKKGKIRTFFETAIYSRVNRKIWTED